MALDPELDEALTLTAYKVPGAPNSSLSEENELEYIFCKDLEGLKHRIRDPIGVLKARLRFVLLILLRNGCDPNSVDDRNKTPSDYASHNGIWSEWSWALERSNLVYNDRNHCYVRGS